MLAVSERGTVAQIRTDSTGAFRVCGIPVGVEATAMVTVPGRNRLTVPVPTADGPLVVLDLLIP